MFSWTVSTPNCVSFYVQPLIPISPSLFFHFHWHKVSFKTLHILLVVEFNIVSLNGLVFISLYLLEVHVWLCGWFFVPKLTPYAQKWYAHTLHSKLELGNIYTQVPTSSTSLCKHLLLPRNNSGNNGWPLGAACFISAVRTVSFLTMWTLHFELKIWISNSFMVASGQNAHFWSIEGKNGR